MALRPSTALAADPVCLQPLDVVFIMDRSGSMSDETGIDGGNNRLDEARLAANSFVNILDNNGGVGGSGLHQVGLTSFAGAEGSASVDLAMGPLATETAFNTAIGLLNPAGNTPLQAGLNAGFGQLTGANRRTEVDGKGVTHVFVLLSDGRPWADNAANRPSHPAETGAYLAGADQAISVLLGQTPADPPNGAYILDPVLMDQLSKPYNEVNPDGTPGGNFFHVVDADELTEVFNGIVNDLLCGDVTITKEASPTTLPFGGGSVTYTYDVAHNAPGGLPFSSVTVTDDKCGPVGLDTPSGDDGDNLLEDGETWHFTCTTNIIADTTNTACVGGTYVGSGGTTIPAGTICATAFVDVGDPPPDAPSMTIVKGHLPIDPPLGPGGGEVTYTYDVNNNGNVDLTNVAVEDHFFGTTDPACSPLSGPGASDVGSDGILSVDETWHYECTATVTATGSTVNEACVTADLVQSDDSIGEDPTICDTDEVGVPEGSQAGGTGTPAASIPNTSTSLPGFGGPLATLVFGLILVASLGTLAYANVRAARQRR